MFFGWCIAKSSWNVPKNSAIFTYEKVREFLNFYKTIWLQPHQMGLFTAGLIWFWFEKIYSTLLVSGKSIPKSGFHFLNCYGENIGLSFQPLAMWYDYAIYILIYIKTIGSTIPYFRRLKAISYKNELANPFLQRNLMFHSSLLRCRMSMYYKI